jgi:hypothetical protein
MGKKEGCVGQMKTSEGQKKLVDGNVILGDG